MRFLKSGKLLTALLFFFWAGPLCGQEPVQFIYLDEPGYEYIDYRINSGRYIPQFVLQQPYQLDSTVFSAGEYAGDYFRRYWSYFYGGKEVSLRLKAGDKVKYYEGEAVNRYLLTGGGHWTAPHITLGNRTTVDQEYKHDPLFAGDLSESDSWLYGRVNDAYLNLRYGGFNLFFGRMLRNWGPLNNFGLILSAHPYTYDHFLFSYRSRKIKLSLIFGQLEDIFGRSIDSDKRPDSVTVRGNSRRFLAGHRLDIAFSKRFQIALTEMAVYGGPGRDIEFSFLNPANFYYPIQRNDRKQMNGIWALDMFYKPWQRSAFYLQFLLDDIIVNNDPGVDDRARFPDRLGLMLSARSGDLLVTGLNTELTFVRIWNQTYQSRRNWENYQYRGLGLGYPAGSLEEIKLRLGYWGLFPLFIQNETIYGRYGSYDITALFTTERLEFPVPPVTHNFLNTFTLRYYYSRAVSLWGRMRYIEDRNHYSNRIDRTKGISLFFGAEINLGLGIGGN